MRMHRFARWIFGMGGSEGLSMEALLGCRFVVRTYRCGSQGKQAGCGACR